MCVCVRLGCTKTDVVDDDGVGAVDDSCFLSQNALVLSLLTRSALLLDRVSEHRPKLLLLCCVSRSEVTLRVLSFSLSLSFNMRLKQHMTVHNTFKALNLLVTLTALCDKASSSTATSVPKVPDLHVRQCRGLGDVCLLL